MAKMSLEIRVFVKSPSSIAIKLQNLIYQTKYIIMEKSVLINFLKK